MEKDYHDWVKELFPGSEQFEIALDKACNTVINFKLQAAEWLACYDDMLLKKAPKGELISEADIDKLKNSAFVLSLVHDRDIYISFYSKFMANRILQNLSRCMDAEKDMIMCLKEEFGHEFTKNVEQMLKDLETS